MVIAAHQQIMAEWWELTRPLITGYISPFVIQEIEAGDSMAAKKRLMASQDFLILEINVEIEHLAQHYFNAFQIPEKARLDAAHLAVAVWHKMDYLLSWNCKHLVNGRVKKALETINAELGLPTPTLCTPEELMEV